MASFSKKLCRAVEKRRLLYDRSQQVRVRRLDIDNAWEAVAAECNENVHSVKTRWRNIRKVLLRCVSKTSSTQTRKTRSRDYYLYDELQFLLPHLTTFGADDLIDSDTEIGTKDHTDDSNECISTISVSESDATPTVTVVEKRKRESKVGITTPTKPLSAARTTASHLSDDKIIQNKTDPNYMVSVPTADGSSSVRIRRINNAANTKLTPKDKVPQEEERELADIPDPLAMKLQGRKLRTLSRPLRERSKSLYMERPIYNGSSDSDADYNPPPRKKAAAVKNVSSAAPSAMVTRKKAAIQVKPVESTAEVIVSPRVIVPPPENPVQKQPSTSPNRNVVPIVNDTDDEDLTGIDMALLAAAAEAEAAAAADDENPGNLLCPVVGADAAIQCNFVADEEDDEFIQRMRKWLQSMTLRQKIIFRRGIYQAYIDVYDDPREFPPTKGSEKFAMAQGAPAIFSGMTPVELRLVRHLAMAVTGHKITSATSPYANFDTKPTTTTTQMSSLRAVGNLPLSNNAGSGITSSHSSNNNNNNKSNVHTNTSDSSLKQTATSTTGMRTPPEKISGNGGGSGSGSSIVRTTAITLTNHNSRTGTNMPRILRKVVRVGNNSSNNSSPNNSSSANASNAVQSPNTLAQRNPTLLRPRLLTSNVNGVSASSSDKQRVYRILASGVVARQSPGPTGNSSPNNTNNPTSFSGAFAMLGNSNPTLPTGINKNATQYRQILPKLPTISPTTSAATTMTTAAGQHVTANGEQKLSGISIRRHVPTGQDGRMQISRRYSVCGNASTSNDIHSEARNAEDAPIMRRSMTGIQAVNIANMSEQSKGITRVRCVQNPTATQRIGTLPPKFGERPVPNQSGQATRSPGNIMTGPLAGVPLNEPIPVAMTTWHTTQPNAQTQQEKHNPSQQQQMKLVKTASSNADTDHQYPVANAEQRNIMDENAMTTTGAKQNCLITSDAFENFVIKNEPLDLEDED